MAFQGIVPAFAKAGVKGLVLMATNEKNLEGVAQEIKAINNEVKILSIGVDISDQESVNAAFGRIKETFGQVDILVNNAGVNLDGEGSLIG